MAPEQARRLVGVSDLFELASRAFAYPDRPLVGSLCDGGFFDDWDACLGDTGAPAPMAAQARAARAAVVGRNEDELFEELRREQSRLYYAMGADVALWPYESAFVHVRRGLPGAPVLFRSPIALAVEEEMREAGVLPCDASTEPVDSASNELAFLSYLHAMAARAASQGSDPQPWIDRANGFARAHALQWLPAFMEGTAEQTGSHALESLALMALQPLQLLG